MQVVVLAERDAPARQDLSKSLEVHDLVIDENAVEIEKRRRKHQPNLPQNPFNLAEVATPTGLCQLPRSKKSCAWCRGVCPARYADRIKS